jgi:Ca-activated chloride channel family protein
MKPSSGSLLFFLLISLLAVTSAQAQSKLEAGSATTAKTNLPLRFELLRVEVDTQSADVLVEQQFLNDTNEQLEGRYLFQTPGGGTVRGFSYFNADQEVVGEVFEREVARQVYEEVSGQKHDPGLFEQVAEGTFSFRIYPIAPGETKRVRVRYDSWLARHGQRVSLSLPINAENTQVELLLRDARGLRNVSSSTHTIKTALERDGATRVVVAAARDGASNFELSYELPVSPLKLETALHRDLGHDAYLSIQLATPEALPAGALVSKDVTIVIDRSGSMSGEPLEQARAGAKQVVERLSANDRVNLVLFDDQAEVLFREPQQVTDDVRTRVLEQIARMQEGGGTNLSLALESALKAQNRDDLPNVILFLTDGQSDPQAALAVARADTSDARVFTVGLGSGVEKALLSRLAGDKRGRFVFIRDTSAIEAEVARLYTQIAAPLLTDVKLENEGAELVDIYPRTLPDVFVDDELRIYARVAEQGKPAMQGTLRLTGRLAGKPFVTTAAYTASAQVTQKAVARNWAAARVHDVLEEIALTGETEQLKNEAIELALAYDMVTPYTSFLALPKSEITKEVGDALSSAREQKRRVREAHADAAALSRDAMPPGDPIITVHAPRNARSVRATFPFGLKLALSWDNLTETWSGRFLVPNDVADGVYDVQVLIEGANGEPTQASVRYTIDSTLDSPSLDVRSVPGGVIVRVTSDEPLREVRALFGGALSEVTQLRLNASSTCAWAFMPAQPGSHALRVLSSDKARNEQLQTRQLELEDEGVLSSTSIDQEICP